MRDGHDTSRWTGGAGPRVDRPHASVTPPGPSESTPLLIVITGPVGGGKSSTAVALASELRRSQAEVAVIDLDLVYGFVRQTGFGDEVAWNRARVGAAALTNAMFSSGMSVVIVEGEFFTPQEAGRPSRPDSRECRPTRLHVEGVLPAGVAARAGRSFARAVERSRVPAVHACEV